MLEGKDHTLIATCFLRAHSRFSFSSTFLVLLMLYVYAMAVIYLTDELITLLQTQAEVALAAADGDPNVAIEILMSQQVCVVICELINC